MLIMLSEQAVKTTRCLEAQILSQPAPIFPLRTAAQNKERRERRGWNEREKKREKRERESRGRKRKKREGGRERGTEKEKKRAIRKREVRGWLSLHALSQRGH